MDIKVGSQVLVYDRFRFAIPLKAIVRNFTNFNDGVRVILKESNNPYYPIGRNDVWVHLAQLRLVSNQNDPGPGGIGID